MKSVSVRTDVASFPDDLAEGHVIVEANDAWGVKVGIEVYDGVRDKSALVALGVGEARRVADALQQAIDAVEARHDD